MQSTSNKNKKALNKIIFTIFRWCGWITWIVCIWAGLKFAINLLATIIILTVEGILIYDNIKNNKSIWG
jgi:hypothetical protein